jgi:two-component system CheB/CheR fusion protein
VVVTHLPPYRDSLLAEILGRATRMPVVNARDDQPVEAEHVYVLPPGAVLTIHEGRLRLRHTGPADHERAPIDVFFTSLAEDQGEQAVGVVLSGGGSDGTLGLKAVKEHGGLTIAQGANVTRPRFADMPSSAVAAGFVDLVLPAEEIAGRIIAYVRDWAALDAERSEGVLNKIYTVLRTRTGHDFSEYKDRTFQTPRPTSHAGGADKENRGLRRSATRRPGGGPRVIPRSIDRGHQFFPRCRGLSRAGDPNRPKTVRGQGRGS